MIIEFKYDTTIAWTDRLVPNGQVLKCSCLLAWLKGDKILFPELVKLAQITSKWLAMVALLHCLRTRKW